VCVARGVTFFDRCSEGGRVAVARDTLHSAGGDLGEVARPENMCWWSGGLVRRLANAAIAFAFQACGRLYGLVRPGEWFGGWERCLVGRGIARFFFCAQREGCIDFFLYVTIHR
jgi:hypothetical protein